MSTFFVRSAHISSITEINEAGDTDVLLYLSDECNHVQWISPEAEPPKCEQCSQDVTWRKVYVKV